MYLSSYISCLLAVNVEMFLCVIVWKSTPPIPAPIIYIRTSRVESILLRSMGEKQAATMTVAPEAQSGIVKNENLHCS